MNDLNIGDFLSKAKDALLDNAAIATWLDDTYGKKLFVYVGVDEKDPPRENTIPHCILLPGDPAQSSGLGAKNESFFVEALWCVRDESVTQTDQSLEANGVKNCAKLGQYIFEALKAMSKNWPASIVDAVVEGAVMAPDYPGRMVIEFRAPNLMGGKVTL